MKLFLSSLSESESLKIGRLLANTLDRGVSRFPSVSVFGTGTQVQGIEADSNGLTIGTLALDSGSLGRCFTTTTVNLTGGNWYSFSWELMEELPDGTGDLGLIKFGDGSISDGSFGFTPNDMFLGGVGRYACIFRVATTGSFQFKWGVGINNNTNGETLKVKNLCINYLSSDNELPSGPSEFNIAGFSAIYNKEQEITIDEYGICTQIDTLPTWNMPKYSNILGVGDSRSDEANDILQELNIMLESSSSRAVPYAQGGWTTSNVIGPTVIGDITYTLDKALNGELVRMTFSNGEAWCSNKNLGSASWDSLLISDFGVNDIAQGVATAQEVLDNIEIIANAGVAKGLNIIITNITPWKDSAGWSAAKQLITNDFNNLVEAFCISNNYVFVDIYTDLGKASDHELLADGLDGDPDYSADKIHMTQLGSQKCADLIRIAIGK